jgi:transcriptional antiterminator RfaH
MVNGSVDNLRADQWTLVYTKPRAEHIAHMQLVRQGFACFLPKVRREKLVPQGRVLVVEPLFARYLFVCAKDGTADWSKVRSTRGAIGIVRFAGKQAVVAPAVMTALRQLTANEDGVLDWPKTAFRREQKVRIIAGALSGLEAVFEAERSADRAQILVHYLNHWQRIELPMKQLDVSN